MVFFNGIVKDIKEAPKSKPAWSERSPFKTCRNLTLMNVRSVRALTKHNQTAMVWWLIFQLLEVLVLHVHFPHLSLDIVKQYSPRCGAAERAVPSGGILFAKRIFIIGMNFIFVDFIDV